MDRRLAMDYGVAAKIDGLPRKVPEEFKPFAVAWRSGWDWADNYRLVGAGFGAAGFGGIKWA